MTRENVIKQHMLSVLAKNVREDGREFGEYRPITIEYGISAKSAEGSARVRIGDTVVVAGVKMNVMPPYPDEPDKGTLMVNVELTALASKDFNLGPPGIDAIEMSRVVDRGIRECSAVDFGKLCIRTGELVWGVIVDIYPINDAGNLFDAAALAAVAALCDTKLPVLEKDVVIYEQRTKTSLPLGELPLSVTVRKIGSFFFVDPTHDEEVFTDARLTFAVLPDGTFCALQKGGNAGLTLADIDTMADLAIAKSKELRGVLQ